jgi:hypothetical protein
MACGSACRAASSSALKPTFRDRTADDGGLSHQAVSRHAVAKLPPDFDLTGGDHD